MSFHILPCKNTAEMSVCLVCLENAGKKTLLFTIHVYSHVEKTLGTRKKKCSVNTSVSDNFRTRCCKNIANTSAFSSTEYNML